LANVLEYVQTEEGENFSWYGESASVPWHKIMYRPHMQ
jgi:hypothetical protein